MSREIFLLFFIIIHAIVELRLGHAGDKWCIRSGLFETCFCWVLEEEEVAVVRLIHSEIVITKLVSD